MANANPYFTSTSSAVSTINTSAGWIVDAAAFLRNYSDADDKFRSVSDDIEARRDHFDIWKRYWRLEGISSETYRRALWGNRAPRVWQQAESVQTTFDRIGQLLQPYRQRFIGADKARFLALTLPSIKDRLGELQASLDSLQTLSSAAFYSEHGFQVLGQPTEEQLDKASTSALLELLLRTRLSSQPLYQCCYEASALVGFRPVCISVDLSQRKRGIDLDLVTRQDALLLRYHFLIGWISEVAELFVEGPTLNTQTELSAETEPQGDSPFLNAVVDAICAQRSSHMQCKFAPWSFEHKSYSWASKFAPGESVRLPHEAPGPVSSVAALLYDLRQLDVDQATDRPFPLSQRIALAFKIAEYGLFLSGTTWFGMVNSGNIHLWSYNSRQYFLEISASGAPYNDDDRRSLAQHIFNVGIFLAELGMGQRIRPAGAEEIHQVGRLPGGETEFIVSDPASGTDRDTVPLSDIISRLFMKFTGDTYAKAVAFCLEDKRDAPWGSIREGAATNEEYAAVLKIYYLRVYKPWVPFCHFRV